MGTLKPYQTKDGHIKESAIKQAQEIIEAVMKECDFSNITFIKALGVAVEPYGKNKIWADFLSDLYINRLHELSGTEPPQF